jgi:O-antigen/teichoic acid export membrane protein
LTRPADQSQAGPDALKDGDDIKALAKGGRTSFLGFLLRLAARIPFLILAGRWYGPEALGRFAYAVIIVEFAATLATIGLKRGLAQQLATAERPHVHVVWDALLLGAIASATAAIILGALPQLMFPNSGINGLEWLLPLSIFALVWSDISLAALAYRLNIAATVRARSIIEPWTISIAAFVLSYYSLRDGLILAYVVSMAAALLASLWPMMRSFGVPRGWRPRPASLLMLARRNAPLAAADAIEWGSRRLDIMILGLFVSPAIVGIYYVAQQVASLPQKLKTSFDPILGPVIVRNLGLGNRAAVARQVAQVGFWIIAAQAGIGLALGIPGEGVMGLVGPNFVGGTGALAFLLIAEVVAATAIVSEAALIYVARHLNLWISAGVIGIQIMLSFAILLVLRDELHVPPLWQAAGPAIGLACALGISSIIKARLLSKLLQAPVSGWRWPLIWAALAAGSVGWFVVQLPEWLELAFGIPAILLTFGVVIWRFGFTSEDRTLFRLKES